MVTRNAWLLGAGMFLITSCGGDKENSNNSIDENGDTLKQHQNVQSQDQDNLVPNNNPGNTSQENYSDEDLKDFIKIDQKLQLIQQEKQGQMIEMVEASDISVEDFQKMSAAQQQGQSLEEFSKSQKTIYTGLSDEISALEKTMMQEFEEIIVDGGYDMDSYRKMANNINSNQQLQQRIQTLVQSKKTNQQ